MRTQGQIGVLLKILYNLSFNFNLCSKFVIRARGPHLSATGRRMPVKHPMSMWAGGRSAESNPKILSRTPRTNAGALHRRPQTRQTEAFFWPQRPRRNSHQAEDSAAAAALLCRVGGGVDKAKKRTRAAPALLSPSRTRDRGFRHSLVLGREPETRLPPCCATCA